MGADLCGYIMIGPMKLDPVAIKETIKEVANMLDLIKKAEAGDKQAVSTLTETYGVDARLTELEAGNLDVLNPQTLVEEFVQMWEHEPYRDMMSRMLPGEKDKKIVVCGERTHGDGPDPDSAWGVTQRAMFFGIPDMLRVE